MYLLATHPEEAELARARDAIVADPNGVPTVEEIASWNGLGVFGGGHEDGPAAHLDPTRLRVMLRGGTAGDHAEEGHGLFHRGVELHRSPDL